MWDVPSLALGVSVGGDVETAAFGCDEGTRFRVASITKPFTATPFDDPDVPGTGPDAADGPYPRARRPSGGLVSNVPDLLRFGRHLLDQPQMRIVHGKPVAGVYGLGVSGERVGGVEVWGHQGS